MRRYLIGVTAALAGSLAMATVSQAAITGQTLTVNVGGTKQDKKVPGPVSLDVNLATTKTAPTVAAQTAAQTDLDFDRDFSFFPGRLAQCNAGSLATAGSTVAAQAACPGAQVGTGDATLCSAMFGCNAGPVPASVVAFNGVPVGGAPSLVLYTKTGGLAAAAPPVILTGTLIPSPAGFPFGRRLSVNIPDTATTGLHITNFHVAVPPQQTQTPTKKQKAKCKKIESKTGRKNCLNKKKKSYVAARCSDRTWDFQSLTQFRAGGPSQSSKTTVSCVKRATKKKK